MELKVGDVLEDGSVVFYDKGRVGKKGWRYLTTRQYDAPKTMTWQKAMEWCRISYKSPGWRLPSRKWLNRLYEARDKVPGLGNGWYWSSSQYGNYGNAWLQKFDDGYQDFNSKVYEYSVRACRALDEQGQPVEV